MLSVDVLFDDAFSAPTLGIQMSIFIRHMDAGIFEEFQNFILTCTSILCGIETGFNSKFYEGEVQSVEELAFEHPFAL